jgi:hypothetical protein
MIRFKEQKRINKAIEHKDSEELQWALSYCRSRLGLVLLKSHVKRWEKQIMLIEAAISHAEYK